MIDLQKEKEYKFSMQEFYQIISNSIDIATENGFLNQFTFERSLYMFAAADAYEDVDKDFILENPLNAWNAMIADGTIDKLVDEFPHELEFLASIGEEWFNSYEAYLHSVRGAFGDISNFMQNMMDDINLKLQNTNLEDASNLIDLAKEWGIEKK